MIEARIKLAEAMGWTWHEIVAGEPLGKWTNQNNIARNCYSPHTNVDFYPFTDADDDYAVLEWLRSIDVGELDNFNWTIWVERVASFVADYEVGDIARAACAALDIELQPPEQEKDVER